MTAKKLFLCVAAVLAVFAAPLSAAENVSVGLTLGYGFLLNPPPFIDGVTDSNGGFQFEFKAQYELLDDFLFGGELSVGVLSGFMEVSRYSDAAGSYGRGDIPFVAFGQLEFGPIYALVGFGFHFWTADGVGADPGMTWGGGYLYDLSEEFALDAGARLHTIFADNALMLTLNVGVRYSF